MPALQKCYNGATVSFRFRWGRPCPATVLVLPAAGPVSIHAAVRGPSPGGIRLMREGEVLRQFGENEVSYSDTGLRPGMHYYRLLCRAGQAEIVSNPIFVRR